MLGVRIGDGDGDGDGGGLVILDSFDFDVSIIIFLIWINYWSCLFWEVSILSEATAEKIVSMALSLIYIFIF